MRNEHIIDVVSKNDHTHILYKFATINLYRIPVIIRSVSIHNTASDKVEIRVAMACIGST